MSNIDLNLLVALDVLLDERNVTRAGVRVGLSQPAMSAALARLRRHFGDELLTRVGNTYELTPLASALVDPTAAAVASFERVFTAQPSFDAAASVREFTVMMSDYALTVLGGPLVRTLREQAPGVRLTVLQLAPGAVDDRAQTLRTVDALLLPHGHGGDYPSADLFGDTWDCVAWTGNGEVGDRLEPEDLGRVSWVAAHGRTLTGPMRRLASLGTAPRIDLEVESYLAVPMLVRGTDRLALVQRRLLEQLPGDAELRVVGCPFDPGPLVEAMWWDPVHQRDAGHAWLRDLLAQVGRGLDGPAPGTVATGDGTGS